MPRVTVVQGDITKQGVDAVVNAADRPPRFVRAVLEDYRFTERSSRRRTGAWWRRRRLGIHHPVMEPRSGTFAG